MKPVFLLRLVLDGIAAGLLLFAFAYYWQGNAAHEVAGLAMFLLLVVHNVFHRRWFSALATGPREPRERFNVVLTCILLAGMVLLLATSLVISETAFPGLRLDDDFTARQIHAGVAYWLLAIVSAHLGLRWPLLMAVARRLLGITRTRPARTVALRAVAAGIAIHGAFSVLALNLRPRFLFQMSLDWWNFEQSVTGFFVHCMSFAGLCIVITYYASRSFTRLRRPVPQGDVEESDIDLHAARRGTPTKSSG